MSNLINVKEKYDQVFKESFSIGDAELNDALEYSKTAAWDSIGHMAMIAALESAFGITMETDDVVNFSSYKMGFVIMAKYGVVIQ